MMLKGHRPPTMRAMLAVRSEESGSFCFRHFPARGHLVCGHHTPERAHRVRVRTFVIGIETVAVGRENVPVSIDIAGGELQLSLHELLHLPLAAIPGHAE